MAGERYQPCRATVDESSKLCEKPVPKGQRPPLCADHAGRWPFWPKED